MIENMEEIFKGLLDKATETYLNALKETTKGIYRSFNGLKREFISLREDLKIINTLTNKNIEQDGKINNMKEDIESLEKDMEDVKKEMKPIIIKTTVLYIVLITSGVVNVFSIGLIILELLNKQ